MTEFLTNSTSWMISALVVMVVVLWAWALIDLAINRRHIGQQSTIWLLLILFLPLLGSMMYFKMIKPGLRDKKQKLRSATKRN